MIWFKACPRCERGDVALDRDLWGWHVRCLQCGYMRDYEHPAEARRGMERRGDQRSLVAQPA